MISSLKNKEEFKILAELEALQPKVKQVRLVEKLGKHGFYYDIKELFEPITKAVEESNQKYLRILNPIRKQLRIWMNQINTLKLQSK